jgi:Domain of unknown function (DUF4258)
MLLTETRDAVSILKPLTPPPRAGVRGRTLPFRWFLTLHALERMGERGVSRDELLATLKAPETTRPADHGRTVAVRGRLSVVFERDVVVTVVWAARPAEQTASSTSSDTIPTETPAYRAIARSSCE